MASRSKPQGRGPALQKAIGPTSSTPPHLQQPAGTAANPFGGRSPHLQQHINDSTSSTPGVANPGMPASD